MSALEQLKQQVKDLEAPAAAVAPVAAAAVEPAAKPTEPPTLAQLKQQVKDLEAAEAAKAAAPPSLSPTEALAQLRQQIKTLETPQAKPAEPSGVDRIWTSLLESIANPDLTDAELSLVWSAADSISKRRKLKPTE